MAVRIQVRRGVQAEIPTLAVGEPGYDVDTKTMRMGDGTSSAPRIPTTKSTGNFDFRTAAVWQTPKLQPNAGTAAAPAYSFTGDSDTGMWNIAQNQIAFSTSGASRLIVHNGGVNVGGNITMSANGTVDGVDISKLNAANGILVRVGANSYANRALAGTPNVIRVDNADGVGGNPIIDIADNPQLPGVNYMTIPSGNTSQRPSPAFDGYLRFNNSPTYRCLELYVDGRWFQLTQKVQAGSYAISIPGTFNTFNEAFDYLSHIMTEGYVTISLGAGRFNLTQSNDFGRLPKGTRWMIQGAVPDTKNITGVSAVAQDTTNGGWSVTYNLNSVAGIAVGDYTLVDRVNFDSTTMAEGYLSFTSGTGNATSKSNQRDVPAWDVTAVPGQSYFLTLQDGGQLMDRRMVTTVSNSGAAILSGNAPFTADGRTYMRQVKITGNVFVHGTNPLRLVGSGTQFLGEINVGDVINVAWAFGTVTAIHSNTELSVEGWFTGQTARAASGTPTTAPGSGLQGAYIMRQGDLHLGGWRVTQVDGISNTITVNVKGFTAPPLKGLRTSGSTLRVMKTVINAVDYNPFIVPDGAQIIVQDIGIVRTLTTSPKNIGFYVYDGGEVEFRRFVMVNGLAYGIHATRGSSIYAAYSSTSATSNLTGTMSFSGCSTGIYASASRFYMTYTILNGNSYQAMKVEYGSTFVLDQNYGDGTMIRNRGLVACNNTVGVTFQWGSFGVIRRLSMMSNYNVNDIENGGLAAVQGSRVLCSGGCAFINNCYYGVYVVEQSYARLDGAVIIAPRAGSFNNNDPMRTRKGGFGIACQEGSVVRPRAGSIISGCTNDAIYVQLSSTFNGDATFIVCNRWRAGIVDQNSYALLNKARVTGNRGYLAIKNRSAITAVSMIGQVPQIGYGDVDFKTSHAAVQAERGSFVDLYNISGINNSHITPKPNALGYNFNAYVMTQLV